MKAGFGVAMVILTFIFAQIALENNKIARAITLDAFNVKPIESSKEKQIKEEVAKTTDINDTNKTKVQVSVVVEEPKEDKWSKFDKEFDSKWNKF